MKLIYTFSTGLVFGLGIAVSGMMNPAKVLNFFDIMAHWDPSLAFVMGGALLVTFFGYRLAWRRRTPLLASSFQIPGARDIDVSLLTGSALFGIGWGIAGFCPGAALPALGTGRWEVVLFIGAVLVGMGLKRIVAPAVAAFAKT